MKSHSNVFSSIKIALIISFSFVGLIMTYYAAIKISHTQSKAAENCRLTLICSGTRNPRTCSVNKICTSYVPVTQGSLNDLPGSIKTDHVPVTQGSLNNLPGSVTTTHVPVTHNR